jgi:hypothetical protein
VKTFLARILVRDDVDVQFLVEQLVVGTSGPGAPLGAVEVELECVDVITDDRELVPVGRVVVNAEVADWDGEPLGAERIG